MLSIYLNKELIGSTLYNGFTIKIKHIYALSIIFILLILVNFQKIGRDLTGDELSYALNSIEHSLGILDRIFEKLPYSIQKWPASQSIQITTLIIILSMFLFAKVLLQVKKDTNFTLLILIATILTRICISAAGGKNYPNSPLPSFFSFITTTIFGVSGITYRLTTLFIFSIVATYLFFSFSSFGKFGYSFAFLTLSLFITSPLLSYMTTANEIANYTLIIGLTLIFALYRNKFIIKPEYLLILSAAFYLRVNIIAFFAIFLLMHFFQNKNQVSKFLSFYTLIFSIILPGLLNVFINRLNERVSNESNFGAEIMQNSDNFISAISVSKSFLALFIALALIAILFIAEDSRKFVSFYIFINFVLFFIVNSSELTKDVKYLVEYLYPLSLSIGMLVLIKFEKKFLVKTSLIIFMIVVNLQGISEAKELKSNFMQNQIAENNNVANSDLFLSFKPLPYRQVFRYTRLHDLNNCFNSGVVYGLAPEIMAGYNLRDINELITQRSNFLKMQARLNEKWTSISPESASTSKIKCVIIGNVDQQNSVLKTFTKAGWVLIANFTDSNFGTRAFILINK